MKHTLTALLIASQIGLASAQSFYDWDNPNKKFPVETSTFQTSVIASDNYQALCERESRNRGFSGFGYSVNSCAFWNDARTQCTIIVPKNTSMHILGHELLHCIKGNWH